MSGDYRLFLACYRSGQMTAACWEGHLRADPLLRLWAARREVSIA